MPNATREAARAAVQAWLRDQVDYDGVAESLAPHVLRLAERCIHEATLCDDWKALHAVARALTAEDRGTDG